MSRSRHARKSRQAWCHGCDSYRVQDGSPDRCPRCRGQAAKVRDLRAAGYEFGLGPLTMTEAGDGAARVWTLRQTVCVFPPPAVVLKG